MLSRDDVTRAVEFIKANKSCLISAPTGTGKTTLIPFELASSVTGRVAVGVPTIISAQSVTKRVSSVNKDSEVIVDSRYRGKGMNLNSQLVFMTYGTLLLDYLHVFTGSSTPSENDFPWSYVIIDEAHTGSLDISLIISLHLQLFNFLGNKAPSLILMTATPVVFKKLVNISHLHLIPKTNIKINERNNKPTVYLENDEPNRTFYNKMAQIISEIHKRNKNNKYHILAFVPGFKELVQLTNLVQSKKLENIDILPAHGGMTDQERGEIEKRVTNRRRLIIATNVAESSITIPNVAFVVDSALEKRITKGLRGSAPELQLSKISKSSSSQRLGRAGRTVPLREYYMMMKKETWELNAKLHPNPPLEINLVSLHKTIITLLSYKINPRAILYEVSQNEISETIGDLEDLEMIKFSNYTQSSNFLQSTHPDHALYYKSIGSTKKVKDVNFLISQGFLLETHEITKKGKLASSLPIGIIASSFLWEWKIRGLSIFSGVIVACVMDTNTSRLFDPVLEKEGAYERYSSSDSLTTVLKVIYDFILTNPEEIASPNKKIVGKWSETRRLRGNIILQIIESIKSVNFLLEEEDYTLIQLKDLIPEVRDCVTRSQRFLKTKEKFYRRKKCVASKKGKCLLEIGEDADKLNDKGFIVPDDFEVPISETRERTYERLPIIEPEDIGLVSKEMIIPQQLLLGRSRFVSNRKRMHSLDFVLEFLDDPDTTQENTVEYEDYNEEDFDVQPIDFTSYGHIEDFDMDFGDVMNIDDFREADDIPDEYFDRLDPTTIIF